jgi:hypothetical protein
MRASFFMNPVLRNAPPKSSAQPIQACGAVAEWSKALAWKVSIRQKRIEGSNPSRSATSPFHSVSCRAIFGENPRFFAISC